MFKKNGFTLVEILGVIILIGILFLLAFPPIMNQIKESSKDIDKATENLIYTATSGYLDKKVNDYPIVKGSVFCIPLQELVNSGDLDSNITSANSLKKVSLSKIVKVEIENAANIDYSIVDEVNCQEKIQKPGYADKSGASKPRLTGGMIPVRWHGSELVKADTSQEWYNYTNLEWANVVLVTDAKRDEYKNALSGTNIKEEDILAYLVWIPRYKYKLFNADAIVSSPKEIEVVFEPASRGKSTGTMNGTYLTHPAFTYNDKEIDGFWIGKFETTGTQVLPTIKPNLESLRGQNISTMFSMLQYFNNITPYGLTETSEAHLIRNLEWGAVAYLSHSKYGKNEEIWMNPSNTFITGCAGTAAKVIRTAGCEHAYNTLNGGEASTTGNVYGVYDMSGGATEYVMGSMFNIGNVTINTSSSGFSQETVDSANMNKYINKYNYGTTFDDQLAYNRRILGDATGETRGWYDNYNKFVSSSDSWFYRGGQSSYSVSEGIGIFGFDQSLGHIDSYRGSRLAISGL
ncbi:MAG: prepilin-type N-terminal cleavage/methylation domain-containing protein [Bacilli bacterium]|nr:prepilin-type N-terminal cleavage/methylation domain-containing protein [Bacilli bacterium]